MATQARNKPARRRRTRYKRPPRLRRNPHVFGMLSGLIFATVVLCVALYRQAQGIELGIAPVLIGAAFVFVVSYGLTGLFALFLIQIAERELVPAVRKRPYKKEEVPPASPVEPAAGEGEAQI